MAKTFLQRNVSYYQRIIAEGKNSPQYENYKKVCEELEKLVVLSNQLNEENRKLSEAEFNNLKQLYAQTENAFNDYFKDEADFKGLEVSRAGILKDILKVLKKDIKELDACDPKEPGTLSEIIDRSRSHMIEISEKDISTIGGNLSERIPIKSNKGPKGFFTRKTHFNPDNEWSKKLEDFENQFGSVSEECKKNLQLLKSDEEFQLSFCKLFPTTKMEFKKRYKDIDKLCSMATKLGMANNDQASKTLLLNNDKLFDNLSRFAVSAFSVVAQQMVMQLAGIKKGSPISSRNCAMTDVAQLLGCDHLLANSVNMKIKIGNEIVDGVFMETADGTDLKRLKYDDPIFDTKLDSFQNPEALMQVADLQVLDFICGNTDRHGFNMVYQFARENNQVKFTGIKGIDNDCAFGIPDVKSDKQIMRMVKPEKMKFITTHMLEKLANIDKTQLEFKLLNNGLSKDEIQAVYDRIDMVLEAEKNNKFIHADKEYWEKNKLANNKNASENYFESVKDIMVNCRGKDYENFAKTSVQVKYVEEVTAAKHTLAKKMDDINNLMDMMNKSKAMFNSEEYEFMEQGFKTIKTLSDQYKQTYDKDHSNITEDMTDQLIDAYIELAKKTEQYISLKKLDPFTTRGKNRVKFASKLLEFAHETLDDVSKSSDREVKRETEKVENVDVKEINEEFENSYDGNEEIEI
jgi:hypothetical protein